MNKFSMMLALLLFPLIMFAGQPKYSRVKIFLGQKPLEALFRTGIEVNVAHINEGFAIAELSADEIKTVQNSGFITETIIPDLENFYVSRNKSQIKSTTNLLDGVWPVPTNFSLGTCGGFSTIDQMLAQLDKMHELYPDLVTIRKPISDSIKTNENRSIFYVKISDNPDADEDEPQVLYTGMHHAREPIGMQHLLFYMWYLLENYKTDPAIKSLVDNVEMYFIPVFNVDGYQYNIDNSPQGGGMWRKNRRDSGNGNYGVDVNRNYGYKWGFDDDGSSPEPYSEIYRGASAFSEPETRMMKQFCENHRFRFAINYHSYSNLCLYPWGYSSTLCDDDSLFSQFSKLMTKESNYTYGPGASTIYVTNGGSDDWMYGEQTSKPKIFAFTPEVGGEWDGFWPSYDRIIPLIQQNMLTSMMAARLAGNYGVITENEPLYLGNLTGYLHINVKRLGLEEGPFHASIFPLDNKIAGENPATITGLKLNQSIIDSLSYTLSGTLVPGDTVRFVLQLNSGVSVTNDTVMHIFGNPVKLFSDPVDNSANWKGTWQRTTLDYYSPTGCMTDSPYGLYTYNSVKSATLANSISIPDKPQVVLQFMAKWDIEPLYDYVQLSISDDNGSNWTPLKGNYTVEGSRAQDPGNPVYQGTQDTWVREAVSLNDYRGRNILLKFTLITNNQNQRDGYYFDDVSISWLPDYTPISGHSVSTSYLGQPYPNPAAKYVSVPFSLISPDTQSRIILFSADGKKVFSTGLLNNKQESQLIPVDGLEPCLYFVTLETAGAIRDVRKVLVTAP